ncbi:MAG: lytic transglycosylase domain-containing protein, partial [Synechococcaceae bacterium WB6_3B_236]|nr:lytic transglycosylase domain-containing protein [Synechococcaceae bacterium WB6_3B_236]
EAWEHWRTWRGGRAPANPQDLWREGQLRLALGDRWLGLAQLDQASLEGVAKTPAQLGRLERQRHPFAFEAELRNAALQAGLDPSLLMGVARQESRLSPAVGSPAGAVGLLQLMPATANELAASNLRRAQLEDPNLNAQLGARYLAQLFKASSNNPFLAVASYNAGPGAAQSWGNTHLNQLPELWVEAIPYPETRLYVKSVLGNRWTYGLLEPSFTRP